MSLVKERWPNNLGFDLVDPATDTEMGEVMDMNENQGLHVKSHNTEKFFTLSRWIDLLGTEVRLHPEDFSADTLLHLCDTYGEDME